MHRIYTVKEKNEESILNNFRTNYYHPTSNKFIKVDKINQKTSSNYLNQSNRKTQSSTRIRTVSQSKSFYYRPETSSQNLRNSFTTQSKISRQMKLSRQLEQHQQSKLYEINDIKQRSFLEWSFLEEVKQPEIPQDFITDQKDKRLDFLQSMGIQYLDENKKKIQEQISIKSSKQDTPVSIKVSQFLKSTQQESYTIPIIQPYDDQSSTQKMIIKIQSQARQKIAVKRYNKLRQQQTPNKQFRSILREEKAAIRIQRAMRGYLVRRKLTKGFIVKSSIIQVRHQFDSEPLKNRMFWFRCQIKENDLMISLNQQQRRNTLPIFRDGLHLKLNQDEFCRILVTLDQYIEFQKKSVDEDVEITKLIELVHQIALYRLQRIIINGEIHFKSNIKFILLIRKLATYLEKLVRIDESAQLILLGFNNFEYNYTYQQVQVEKIRILNPPLFVLNDISSTKLFKIIKIQNFIKVKQSKEKFRIQFAKLTKKLVLKQFTVRGFITGSNKLDFFHVWIFSDREREKSPWVQCRSENLKLTTQPLEISQLVTKQIGQTNAQNFFEIYQILNHSNKLCLNWSEEGAYWINRECFSKSKGKNRLTLNKMVTSVLMLQRAFRRSLFLTRLRIVQEKKRRLNEKLQNKNRISLVQKVVLMDENETKKAYYLNFFLITERFSEESKNIDPEQQKLNQTYLSFMQSTKNCQKKTQKFQIFCRSVEQDGTRIQPYVQKLFKPIKMCDLVDIAKMMLMKAEILPGKNGFLTLKVRNLEELQGMIINERNRKINQEFAQHESLTARRIFNNTQKKKYLFQNQSVFEYLPQQVFQPPSTLIYKINTGQYDEIVKPKSINVYKLVKHLVRAWNIKKKNKQQQIKEQNEINIHSQNISEYIRNTRNISQYCYGNHIVEGERNINFLDELKAIEENKRYLEEFKQSEHLRLLEEERKQYEERKKLWLLTRREIYSDFSTISQNRVFLKILYNKITEEIIIEVQLNVDEKKYGDQLSQTKSEKNLSLTFSKGLLIPGVDINEEYLKLSIQLIIFQLQIDSNSINFISDTGIQLKYFQDYQIYLKDKEYNELINKIPINGLTQDSLNKIAAYKSNIILQPIDILQKLNFKVINMRKREINETYEYEYLYNITDDSIVIIITSNDDRKVRQLFLIKTKSLQCGVLFQKFHTWTPEEIIRTMTPFLEAIEKNLEVSLEGSKITTNFQQFKPFLSIMLQDQLLRRIQNKSLVILGAQKFKQLQGKQHCKQIYLYRQIQNSDGRYIDIRFYLVKEDYKILIYVEEKNTIDGNGNIVSRKNSDDSSFIQLNSCCYNFSILQFMDRGFFNELTVQFNVFQKYDIGRVDPTIYLQLENHYPLQYYRKTFGPVIRLIISNMKIGFNQYFNEAIQVNFGLLDRVISKVEKRDEEIIQNNESPFYAVINAVIKISNQIKTASKRNFFKLWMERKQQLEIKRKQIGDLVKRTIKKISNQIYIVLIYKINYQLTFDLIPYTNCLLDRRNNKNRLRYIYIIDDSLMLNIGSKSIYDYICDQLYVEENQIFLKQEDFEQIETLNSLPQQMLDSSISQCQESLVHNSEDIQKQTIYNVVYSGKKALQRTQITNNTVELQVNLKNVHKLYPTLKIGQRDFMQKLSTQLVEGVKVDQNGKILIDQNKINPSFIKLTENRINKQSIQQQPSSRLQRSKYTQVLAKKTTHFKDKKFLLSIYQLEQKIKKIIPQPNETIFEEYEIHYQVTSNNITDRINDLLKWGLTPNDAQILTGQKDKFKIAEVLLQRLEVTSEYFIFMIANKNDINLLKLRNPQVLMIPEVGIKPIQKKFKDREFHKNYRKYKQFTENFRSKLGKFNSSVHCFSVEKLNCPFKQFIVLCADGKSKQIMIYAWDLETFKMYEIEIPKSKYTNILLSNKKAAARALATQVEYINHKLLFQPDNQEIMRNFQEQCLETQSYLMQQ